jgi:hypothetical protein
MADRGPWWNQTATSDFGHFCAEVPNRCISRIESMPPPADCTDGFFEAFWNRPEQLLWSAVRAAQSMWALLSTGVEGWMVVDLEAALGSGAWDAEHGHCAS